MPKKYSKIDMSKKPRRKMQNRNFKMSISKTNVENSILKVTF